MLFRWKMHERSRACVLHHVVTVLSVLRHNYGVLWMCAFSRFASIIISHTCETWNIAQIHTICAPSNVCDVSKRNPAYSRVRFDIPKLSS